VWDQVDYIQGVRWMTSTSMDFQIGLIVQRSRIVLLYNLGIFEVNVCMF